MDNKSKRARLMASTFIVGTAFTAAAAGQAAAQATNPAAAPLPTTTAAPNEAVVSAVVITGSRIPQPNLHSASPVTVQTDAEVKAQGTTNVETLLDSLPSVMADQNQGTDNGATGTAQIALRNLTPNRTLVLVDGKRLMPGDPAMQGGLILAPDLNNIPAAMVDRVEVLTGGASSVYGSDALAGVVNFIMKKNFSGVRLDTQWGFSDHNNSNAVAQNALSTYNASHSANPIPIPGNHADGYTTDLSLLLGMNAPDDKGNITAYATYRHLQPVTQDKRDYGACGISTLVGPPDQQVCQGSSNSAFGRFFGPNTANNPNGTNTFVPYSGAFAFNFGPYNYYQRQDKRYTAGYSAHYDISKAFEAYSDLMFADDSTIGQAAPSGLFNTASYLVGCSNPLASASQLATLCGTKAGTAATVNETIGYRLAGVPRVTTLTHTSYRIDAGLRGDLGHGWNYDAYVQYGNTKANEEFTGDVSISKINNALNVTLVNGVPTCVNDSANCVPLNIFKANSAGITSAALKYILANALKTGSTTEKVASANITGDLGTYGMKSPWSSDGIGINVGAEYRREELALTVDQEFSSGDLSGNGGVNPPAQGAFDVKELFGELQIPLVQDAPLAKSISLNTGYRYSDYSSAGTTSAYKLAGDWQYNDDIRFRASYNRAVRAPNIAELFQPTIIQLASFGDPCSGSAPQASLAACLKTGVTAAQYGHIPDCGSAQCSIETGGNPNLRPEKGDTFGGGIVLTPKFIPGFTASIDYFYIIVNDAIQQGIGGSVILSQCLTTGNFCSLIHRNQTSGGSLNGITTADGYVINTTVNSGYEKTSGIDFAANYRTNLRDWNLPDWGSLSFAYVGTYTNEFVQSPVKGLGSFDCAGLYGVVCFEPQSKYKHELRTTWSTPWHALALSVNWRFLSGVSLDANKVNNTFLGVEGSTFYDTADARIPAYNYFDLSASMHLVDHVNMRLGVNNIFDKDPPVVDANNIGIAGTSGFGNGNTFPGVYDTMGRTFFIGLTADF